MIRDSMIVKADALRRARERAGLSQRELAEAVGLSRPFIVMLERGTRTRCSYVNAESIARGCAAPLAELFEPRQYDLEHYTAPHDDAALVTG
jgi:transcriptional regulator with XRE-family HTH domain